MSETARINNTAVGQSRQYDYYAFISYKRADWKWAKWIRENLHSYRLPNATCKRHDDKLAKRCSPVFLDKMNLTPGMLDEGLKSEVQSSKYLIVICSKAAHNESKYLDEEIQYFLEGGGTPSQIIPFIIDPYESSVTETFPLRLIEEYEKSPEDLSCIDANKEGKRKAFLETVAYMHGISPDEIIKDDRKRRNKRISIILSATVAILVICSYSGYRIWDFYTPKKSYYIDYAERYGVPEGVGELTLEQARLLNRHYCIVTSRGFVREIRYEDSYGRLADYGGFFKTAHDDEPVCACYEYSRGILDKTTWKDKNENTVVIWNYSDDLKTVDLQRYSDQTVIESYVEGSFLTTDSGSEKNSDSNSNAVRYLIDYDESGYKTEVRYSSDTRRNLVAVDGDGVAGVRFKRDEKGRVTEKRFISYCGDSDSALESEAYRIFAVKGGSCGQNYTYSNDRLVSIESIGTDGKPAILKNSYSIEDYEYDEIGRIVNARHYDHKHRPSTGDGRVFRNSFSYDERGNISEIHYYGRNDRPVEIADRSSSQKNEYDERGNLIRQSFYDRNGELCVNPKGYCSALMSYDENDNCTSLYFLGKNEKIVMSEYYGYAAVQFGYDEYGNQTVTRYLDAALNPTVSNKGDYVFQASYDEHGRQYWTIHFGLDGKPVVNKYGYCGVEQIYDERGNVVELRAYGPDQELVDTTYGYAIEKFLFDNSGNKIMEGYYNSDGARTVSNKGYSFARIFYDEKGNIVRKSFYDDEENPVITPVGAEIILQYDEKNNVVKEVYLGYDGKPVITECGYAGIFRQFDEFGNNTMELYSGTDGSPVVPESLGYAGILRDYDENGNEIESIYIGADFNPVTPNGKNYSSISKLYDEDNNLVGTATFGPDGELVMDEGYAYENRSYNEWGDLTEIVYVGIDGKPVVADCGFSKWKGYYDESGRIVKQEYYDDKGTIIRTQETNKEVENSHE
ncbi:MAG: TIR domain-containing protein [Lachnospiraceae bacterium]|nr:TIR domain-containing protein [Lachnospiraceae bacterium]